MDEQLERLNAIAHYYGFPPLKLFTKPRPPINFYQIQADHKDTTQTQPIATN